MEHQAGVELLAILIENGRRILDAGFGVDRAEATFFDIVTLLRERPDLRESFLERVQCTLRSRDPSGLDEGFVPRELTELASHELRWREFEELANERLNRFFHGDRKLAASDPARSIIDALQDSWEDREFYRTYAGS